MQKHQTSNTKLRRTTKRQTSNARRRGKVLPLVFGIWCFFGIWCLVLGASDAGFGPTISVPRDLPKSESHKLPKPNWVDQSQADVLRKSRGCMECHKGIENPSMHVSRNV